MVTGEVLVGDDQGLVTDPFTDFNLSAGISEDSRLQLMAFTVCL